MAKKTNETAAAHEIPQPAGGPEMRIEMWPIDQPQRYGRNARKLSAKAISMVAASIKEFGWQQPIVVDSQGVIIIGHTRQQAGKSLGLTECPVHVARDLTPAQVKALRIMENRSHEESTWDQALLGLELVDLKALEVDLALTGLERKEIIEAVFADLPEDDTPAGDEDSGEEPQSSKAGAAHERGLQFRVIVDCADEMQQTELLDRFEQEGLKCKALIS